jgi:hypothetical protein
LSSFPPRLDKFGFLFDQVENPDLSGQKEQECKPARIIDLSKAFLYNQPNNRFYNLFFMVEHIQAEAMKSVLQTMSAGEGTKALYLFTNFTGFCKAKKQIQTIDIQC